MSAPGRPVANEIEREARRILPHLARPRAFLAPAGEGRLGVFVPRGQWKKPIATLDERFIEVMRSREWISLAAGGPPTDDQDVCRYVLTPIGEAFVRRGQGNDHAAQHRDFVRTPEGAALRSVSESPIAWLRARRGGGAPFLTEEEFEAGERLRCDFTAALMTPRITSHFSQERIDTSTRTDYSPIASSDGAAAARRRFWRALDATGPDLASVLVSAVCHLEGLEEIERSFSLPQRSAKTVLKLGLQALARHYGLAPAADRGGLLKRVRGEMPAA